MILAKNSCSQKIKLGFKILNYLLNIKEVNLKLRETTKV